MLVVFIFFLTDDWIQLEVDEAQGQLQQQQQQQAQDALHAPPDEMQVNEEDEPQEIQGVSELDTEAQVSQFAQVESHSPAESEASINM